MYNSSDINLNEVKIDDVYFKHIFSKLNTKIRNINDKLYISNEINELRNDIHSKLYNEYSNIIIKPNISFSQLQSLIRFQKEKSFKVINCDKNVGLAIISNELYNESVLKFLNTDTAFVELLEDPLYDTKNYIKDEIINSSNISNKLGKCLLKNIENTKLGSFRLLAKLHKPKFSWRPVINCKDHPNSKICNIIDLILKPIVIKTET